MKQLILIASLLISSYTYGIPSTSHDIEERDGIVYEVKSGEPFTGIWKFFREDKLVLREEYKDGKKHGLFETYDELKRLKLREHFKDGKKHGLFERFDCHGSGRNPKCQLADRDNYKDGKLHGLSESFFAYWGNGQICQRTEFKEGERNGIHEVFNEKGELVEKGITTDDGEFIRANVPLAEIIDHILC
jgi:antitoxin component YwqK of YwqJK toxin-antitoxin module